MYMWSPCQPSHACSLAPESSVPVEDLVHVIAQLCYTCLVSLRLERPMESQHPLAVECSETVITIICGVQEVACALLKQFQSAFSERSEWVFVCLFVCLFVFLYGLTLC